VDANTGSLGQGASIAVGMAVAAKHKKSSYRVFAVLGDGELQEGQIWEAAMSAAHYKLDNLTFVLDHNGLQIDGRNDEVMGLGSVMDKFAAFGFQCFDVDGHDMDAIAAALAAPVSGKPKFIRCRTVKGRGVSFMEDNSGWHGKPMNAQEFEAAMKELGESRMAESKSLRVAYGEALVELGAVNDKVVVLDADLAHATMTSLFQAKYRSVFSTSAWPRPT
jgi:transketolase